MALVLLLILAGILAIDIAAGRWFRRPVRPYARGSPLDPATVRLLREIDRHAEPKREASANRVTDSRML